MTSFELNKLQGVSAARPLGESDRAKPAATKPEGAPNAGARPATSEPSARPGVSVEVGAAIDASKPPVDSDRVAEIRAALRDGSYPIVPAKIVDAMIAARIGFGLADGANS